MFLLLMMMMVMMMSMMMRTVKMMLLTMVMMTMMMLMVLGVLGVGLVAGMAEIALVVLHCQGVEFGDTLVQYCFLKMPNSIVSRVNTAKLESLIETCWICPIYPMKISTTMKTPEKIMPMVVQICGLYAILVRSVRRTHHLCKGC